MKKKYLIFIIVFLIIMFLVGFILILNSKTEIYLTNDEFVFEYGEEVCADVKCYLKDASSTKDINNYKINFNDAIATDGFFVSKDSEYLNVGEYTLTISSQKKSKTFIIKVVDTTPPEFIEFNDIVILEENSIDVDLTSFFKASDLTEVTISVDGNYDLGAVGEYTTKVIASDQYNNKTEKNFTIKIIDFEAAKEEDSVTKNIEGTVYKSATMVEYENNKKEQENKKSSSSVFNNYNSSATSTDSTKNTNSSSSNSNNNSPRYRKDISDLYVSQINSYRISQGLSELPVTAEAQAEADRRAKEIVTNQSHDGSSYGFGENIGGGAIGTNFFNLWMNSHAHYNAIIREQNVAIASSVYEIDGMWYAVVVFRMNY